MKTRLQRNVSGQHQSGVSYLTQGYPHRCESMKRARLASRQ